MLETTEKGTGNGGEGYYYRVIVCPACGTDLRPGKHVTLYNHLLYDHEPGDFGASLAELGFPDSDVLEQEIDTRKATA